MTKNKTINKATTETKEKPAKQKQLQIKINLEPNLGDETKYPDTIPRELIDWDLAANTRLYQLLFGNKEAEAFRYNMKYALVQIDRVELLIPYSEFREDYTKAYFFKSLEGDEIHILSKENAIKIYACFYLMHLIISAVFGDFYMPYEEKYEVKYLVDLLDKLKDEVFNNAETHELAFEVL